MEKITTICDISTKPYLNLREAVTLLGFGNANTFREWRETGKLEYYKVGRSIVYSQKALNKFMNNHLVKTRI